MKDAEFIELLNLYLDHEITPAGAARLEAEVQRDPARREVYRQYCRMQKACSLLAKDFATEPSSRKVVDFEAQPSVWRPAVWAGAGLMAAACAALLFFGRGANLAPAGGSANAVAYTPPVLEPQVPPPAGGAEPRVIARTIAPLSRRGELQAALDSRAYSLAGAQAITVSAPAPQLDWIRQVQLAPMQVAAAPDELRFEPRTTLKPEPAVYRSRKPIQGNVEMTAFQFQK